MSRQKGFLVLAQDRPGVDYVLQARVLARSLRKSQSQPVGISLVTDRDVPCGDEFEYVIRLPQDDASGKFWKIHNKWQLWKLSPYEKTIWLDSDVVVPVDISWWWEQLHGTPIRFCSRPLDFRGEPIDRGYYRETWLEKDLPMVYTGMVYFDRSAQARRIFEVAKSIFRDWKRVAATYGIRQKATGDLVFSLAVDMLDCRRSAPEVDDFFTFVHMKPKTFRMDHRIEMCWINSLSLRVNGDVRIEELRQGHPLHYVEKSLAEIFAESF
jgi:hypothetical protein